MLGSRKTQDVAWNQAELSLSYGGLATAHSCAAYIASLCSSGLCAVDSPHMHAGAEKAHLLVVSAPHATSWISVVPSVSLGLYTWSK